MKNEVISYGICIDTRIATIIALDREKESRIFEIKSQIDEVHPAGGARTRSPYGPMDKVSDKPVLRRRLHQEKIFFTTIMQVLKPVPEILIFGHGDIRKKFKKVMERSHKFRKSQIFLEKIGDMTLKQKVAYMKSYFESANIK